MHPWPEGKAPAPEGQRGVCIPREKPLLFENHSLALLCLPQKRGGQVPWGGALSPAAQIGPWSLPYGLVSLQALAGRGTATSSDRLGSPAPGAGPFGQPQHPTRGLGAGAGKPQVSLGLQMKE